MGEDQLGWGGLPSSSGNNPRPLSHVGGAMSIRVECYAGYRGEQEPRVFLYEGQRIVVDEVIDRWLAPDHRYFKVKDASGCLYILRHDTESGEWTVTASRLPLSS